MALKKIPGRGPMFNSQFNIAVHNHLIHFQGIYHHLHDPSGYQAHTWYREMDVGKTIEINHIEDKCKKESDLSLF